MMDPFCKWCGLLQILHYTLCAHAYWTSFSDGIIFLTISLTINLHYFIEGKYS